MQKHPAHMNGLNGKFGWRPLAQPMATKIELAKNVTKKNLGRYRRLEFINGQSGKNLKKQHVQNKGQKKENALSAIKQKEGQSRQLVCMFGLIGKLMGIYVQTGHIPDIVKNDLRKKQKSGKGMDNITMLTGMSLPKQTV